MSNNSELNNPVFWYGALVGLYMWSFWLYVVARVRSETLARYSSILDQLDLPPAYSQISEQQQQQLPSYKEAVLRG